MIRNALYLKEIKIALLPPFIMILDGVEVDECPKLLSTTPSIHNNSVYSK